MPLLLLLARKLSLRWPLYNQVYEHDTRYSRSGDRNMRITKRCTFRPCLMSMGSYLAIGYGTAGAQDARLKSEHSETDRKEGGQTTREGQAPGSPRLLVCWENWHSSQRLLKLIFSLWKPRCEHDETLKCQREDDEHVHYDNCSWTMVFICCKGERS